MTTTMIGTGVVEPRRAPSVLRDMAAPQPSATRAA